MDDAWDIGGKSRIVRESVSGLAWYISIEGVGGKWIPKSVIHADSEVWRKGHAGKLIVKAWWAERQTWI